METVAQQVTVADFCQMLERHELRVNKDYQRSSQVWPDTARSFLIETILLDFPIPKLAFHQRTDLQSRRTVKEIVDGQQRSRAIHDFYRGELKLSAKLELADARGRRYEELDDEYKQRFLEYGLNVDLFVGATDADVREAFRRINSHTVPLNPEEQRHAEFQGPFKWFIHRLTGKYDESLKAWGSYTTKSLARMQDAKLYTEVTHALLDGITTTDKNDLRGVYQRFEKDFPMEEEIEKRFADALTAIAKWSRVHSTPLMKPYNLYAAILAVMHVHERITSLTHLVPTVGKPVSVKYRDDNLAALADAAETEEDEEDEGNPLATFVSATSGGTNVRSKREQRFIWFVRALTEPSLV